MIKRRAKKKKIDHFLLQLKTAFVREIPGAKKAKRGSLRAESFKERRRADTHLASARDREGSRKDPEKELMLR